MFNCLEKNRACDVKLSHNLSITISTYFIEVVRMAAISKKVTRDQIIFVASFRNNVNYKVIAKVLSKKW